MLCAKLFCDITIGFWTAIGKKAVVFSEQIDVFWLVVSLSHVGQSLSFTRLRHSVSYSRYKCVHIYLFKRFELNAIAYYTCLT